MNVELLLVLNCIKMDRSLGPDHVVAMKYSRLLRLRLRFLFFL